MRVQMFKRDFGKKTSFRKGEASRSLAYDTRPGTVADLFEAYIGYFLKDAGRTSWGRKRRRASTKSQIR